MHLIDSHIHLDLYEDCQIKTILEQLPSQQVNALISVSNHYESAKRNLALTHRDKRIKPAFGFHPEQALPFEEEIKQLFHFIKENRHKMIAVGEVGLPYYMRQENPDLNLAAYIHLLEEFVVLAAELNKPIVLHAICEDASIVLDLLEKYKIKKAHFHWFKGDADTIKRLLQNDYVVSITPDLLYEKEIQTIVKQVPLKNLLVETDGPWPFEGPFQGKMTHPGMMHETIESIAKLKKVTLTDAYQQIYDNTYVFYELDRKIIGE